MTRAAILRLMTQAAQTSPWQEAVRGAVTERVDSDADGLAQLQIIRERPPMSRLTGIMFEGAERGTASFTMPATPWLAWSHGGVPGGVLAIVSDSALGCAVQTELPAHVAYTTAELSLTYVRPVTIGSHLTAHGTALYAGRSLGLSTADVRDETGQLVAFASTRCSVFGTPGNAPRRGGSARHPGVVGGPVPETPDPYRRPPVGELLDESVFRSRDGLGILHAQISGELPLPPLHHLTGVAPVEASAGRASCVLPLSGWTATPYGWPQGGFIAMLADLSLALAVQTTVRAGGRFASVDLKVNFLRPVACDGSLLTAHAQVVQRGRSLAVATSEVVSADGKRVALATGSCALRLRSEE